MLYVSLAGLSHDSITLTTNTCTGIIPRLFHRKTDQNHRHLGIESYWVLGTLLDRIPAHNRRRARLEPIGSNTAEVPRVQC